MEQDFIREAAERLVQLAVTFQNDGPRFSQAQLEYKQADPQPHEAVQRLVTALTAGDRSLEELGESLLAVRAIDEALHEESGIRAPRHARRVMFGGQAYYLHRRLCPTRRKQADRIETYLRHHRVFPEQICGYRIRIARADRLFQQQLRERDAGALKVAIAHFNDAALVETESVRGGFVAKGLSQPAARQAALDNLLDRARTERVNILVLPELTVTPELRDGLKRRLERHAHPDLVAVLAGSFHELDQGKLWNRAVLLNGIGEPVHVHDKFTRFGDDDDPLGIEMIATGDTIPLLSTSLGLVATPICKDFMHEGVQIAQLWKEVGADWFLVCSMSNAKTMRGHRARAGEMSRTHGSMCAVANQVDPDDPMPGFILGTDENHCDLDYLAVDVAWSGNG
ncbi:MAG TPA: hypothetical protein VIG99_10175 [Myxococcaceae bacterium]|jgi:predicted amidohydrolase